ncbi:hypothetical protein SUGI_0943950 [Cryptomeria japonica]|nr:hypothetical protein SUGI_0943950 [Cryptomeria japonica]
MNVRKRERDDNPDYGLKQMGSSVYKGKQSILWECRRPNKSMMKFHVVKMRGVEVTDHSITSSQKLRAFSFEQSRVDHLKSSLSSLTPHVSENDRAEERKRYVTLNVFTFQI